MIRTPVSRHAMAKSRKHSSSKHSLVLARVEASTSTQYLGTSTSTLKMFKYKYKYRVLRNVLGYYPSTLQMYLGTINKYQVQMYNLTHKHRPVNA